MLQSVWNVLHQRYHYRTIIHRNIPRIHHDLHTAEGWQKDMSEIPLRQLISRPGRSMKRLMNGSTSWYLTMHVWDWHSLRFPILSSLGIWKDDGLADLCICPWSAYLSTVSSWCTYTHILYGIIQQYHHHSIERPRTPKQRHKRDIRYPICIRYKTDSS